MTVGLDPHQWRRDVEIPMSDGVVLRADVFLPAPVAQGRAVPVLLQRTPYDKSVSFGTQHIVGLEISRALDAGFAIVIQDCRGRYASDGEFHPFHHEADDGRDTIAWLVQQDYCDGTVMGYGASYVGATQMLAATRSPQGLVAVAPGLTASDYHEGWTYQGGAFQLGFVLLWIIESLAGPDVLRRHGDTGEALETLMAAMRDPVKFMRRLPVHDEALHRLAPYVTEWVDHAGRDAYWTGISPQESHGSMDVPALHIGGWNDLFIEGTLRNFAGLSRVAASERAREGQFLVVGPWSHGNMSAWQGDAWHGYAAEAGSLDLTATHLEFFSSIAGERRADLPRVQAFTSGVDEWRHFEDWPPPGCVVQTWRLDAATMSLGPDAAPSPQAVDVSSDPADPVLTVGGPTFLPGLLLGRNSGPKNLAEVEARDDVLVFTSASLTTELHVAGQVELQLLGCCSTVDCDWAVRLADVDESGVSTGVTDGILRSRYRHGPEPLALEPGVEEAFTILVGSTSHVFRQGHRLRVQIAGSNFPRFDRNPHTMADPARVALDDMVPTVQTVFCGGGEGTRLLLPVLAE